MNIQPVTLTGRYVRLEPLSLDHVDRLAAVGLDQRIWQWNTFPVDTHDVLERYVEKALTWQEQGTAVPFATLEASSDTVVGSTRFANIVWAERRVEIGWTWIAPDWQRTAINTEAKYLMLSHAFDVWGCARVELKTDALNERSRNAILRIGAKEEGILRKHMLTSTGRWRDSVYYSVLDTEWPQVREHLQNKLIHGA